MAFISALYTENKLSDCGSPLPVGATDLALKLLPLLWTAPPRLSYPLPLFLSDAPREDALPILFAARARTLPIPRLLIDGTSPPHQRAVTRTTTQGHRNSLTATLICTSVERKKAKREEDVLYRVFNQLELLW